MIEMAQSKRFESVWVFIFHFISFIRQKNHFHMNQREEVDILFRSHLNTNPNIEISLEPPVWPFGRSLKILSLEIICPFKNFAHIGFMT